MQIYPISLTFAYLIFFINYTLDRDCSPFARHKHSTFNAVKSFDVSSTVKKEHIHKYRNAYIKTNKVSLEQSVPNLPLVIKTFFKCKYTNITLENYIVQ